MTKLIHNAPSGGGKFYEKNLHKMLGFPGKNTAVGCHFFHQGIFSTQRSNSGLPAFQVDSLLNHQD